MAHFRASLPVPNRSFECPIEPAIRATGRSASATSSDIVCSNIYPPVLARSVRNPTRAHEREVQRATLLVYVVNHGVTIPWFASMKCDSSTWSLAEVKGLGRPEVQELLQHPPGLQATT